MSGARERPDVGDYLLLAMLGHHWMVLLLAALVAAAAMTNRSRIMASGAAGLVGMLAYYTVPFPIEWEEYFHLNALTPFYWCWLVVLISVTGANVRAWWPRRQLETTDPTAK